MENKLTFILGGASSGKTRFALDKGEELGKKRIYLATASNTPNDLEMGLKIKRHKKERGRKWQTMEEPLEIGRVMEEMKCEVLVIDCLTLWLSNMMFGKIPEDKILGRVKELKDIFHKKSYNLIIISNEVGLSIVPENSLSRKFREYSGAVNQIIAKMADEVFWVVAGIGVKIK